MKKVLENTAGKGENAGSQHFLLFQQCFLLYQREKLQHLICRLQMFSIWSFRTGLILPKQALVFTCLQYKPFENTVGKGEIAQNEQFLLFPQCFLPVSRTFFPFLSNLKMSSANSFSLEESKIYRLGKG